MIRLHHNSLLARVPTTYSHLPPSATRPPMLLLLLTNPPFHHISRLLSSFSPPFLLSSSLPVTLLCSFITDDKSNDLDIEASTKHGKQQSKCMPSENIWQSKSSYSGNEGNNMNAYSKFKIQVLLEGVETLGKTNKIEIDLQEEQIGIYFQKTYTLTAAFHA